MAGLPSVVETTARFERWLRAHPPVFEDDIRYKRSKMAAAPGTWVAIAATVMVGVRVDMEVSARGGRWVSTGVN